MARLAIALVQEDVGDLLLEADLAAQGDDLLAHVLDHRDEAEGADVGFGDEEDFLGRAGLDEFFQNLAAEMARVLDLRIEFAVGECAGAAFAELGVGGGVELGLAPEPERVDRALADDLAAFEDDGVEAHLGEDERCEEAAGAEADDDGAFLAGRSPERAACRLRSGVRPICLSFSSRFSTAASSRHLAVDGVDQLDRGRLAGVVGALEDGEGDERCIGKREAFEDRLTEGRLGMIERQLQFLDAEHRSFPHGGGATHTRPRAGI